MVHGRHFCIVDDVRLACQQASLLGCSWSALAPHYRPQDLSLLP